MGRIRRLLIKELLQLRRDRRLFMMLLISPTIQLLVLGFAATTDVREIDLGVRDYDRTAESRRYVDHLGAGGYFHITYLEGPEASDGERLVTGRSGLVLVIPRNFQRDIERRETVSVQILVDGSDSNFAAIGMSYLARATALYSGGLVKLAGLETASRPVTTPSVVFETRAWFNPELLSRNFMVPGVMGMVLMVTTMIVTSMSLVKEREQGTMEQLIVTPLTSGEIITGKLLPFVGVGFAEITLTLPIVVFVYGIAPKSSIAMLYLLSGLFLVSTLGLGLLVSTFSRTQQQAMMIAAFFVMMPFMLLSGFVFPVANMPKPIQYVAALMPLKYFFVIVRGIFLKGATFRDLWREALVLLFWGPAVLGLAVLRFRRRLD
jgi:ABC-2 type transport system permease protein